MAPQSRSKKQDKQTRSKKGGNSSPQGHQGPRSGSALTAQPCSLSLELRQIILNTFNIAFPMAQDPEYLKRIIQEVKGHLFNREFSSAFGQPSYLQAYALRWSAARTLGYSQILSDPKRSHVLQPFPDSCTRTGEPTDEKAVDPQDPRLGPETSGLCESSCTKVVCIGGGAGAEFVALAATQRALEISSSLQIIAVDNADWSQPIARLSAALSDPPSLSSHASEAFKARPENQAMLPDPSKVGVAFLHQDVLSWSVESFQETFQDVSLCTMMFTLNELFSSSLPKTTAFLLRLTDSMPVGSHLLVVDSPGSYSEISLGKDKDGGKVDGERNASTSTKKYPMKWLLDHTLLEVANQGETKWGKIESEDSLWFRIKQTDRDRLRYAVELENMRYQLHLYRRQ